MGRLETHQDALDIAKGSEGVVQLGARRGFGHIADLVVHIVSIHTK